MKSQNQSCTAFWNLSKLPDKIMLFKFHLACLYSIKSQIFIEHCLYIKHGIKPWIWLNKKQILNSLSLEILLCSDIKKTYCSKGLWRLFLIFFYVLYDVIQSVLKIHVHAYIHTRNIFVMYTQQEHPRTWLLCSL